MFIHVKNIQALFSDCRNQLLDNNLLPACLGGFLAVATGFTPSVYNSHYLYVMTEEEFQGITPTEGCCYLVLTAKLDSPNRTWELPACHISILLVETTDFDMACIRLAEFYDEKNGMGLFSESLLEILFFEGGIQAMIEKVYPAIKNPIYVFDADYRLIATTWDAAADLDQGAAILENGGFTTKEFEVMNLTRTHERLKNSEYPIRSTHPIHGYDQLLCTIDSQKDMGHIVVNGINRPLTDMDCQMLYLLKKAIDQQLKKDEFIRNNRGFHHEYFLRDLLDGKVAVGRAYEHRLDYVNTEFSGSLYCMVVETARSSHTLNTLHIRSVFENQFSGTMTLMYNGAIILLFRLPLDRHFDEEDYEQITAICLEYGLFAGIGNRFSNIMEIPEYYHQALRSIELGGCGSSDPGLFRYQDYYLAHMAAVFTQKESANTFSHPDLKLLLNYDKKHGSDLAHILYVYLTCERNIASASQALFMHRNTLVYRLKKISSLISADLEDYRERQHLILSYELQMNQGRR